MAKITTITNPLTGQPAQVDQLDHTAQQIDDAISRALPGGAIDSVLSSKPNPNLLDGWYFANPVDQRQGRVVKPNTTYYSDKTLTTSAGTTSAYVTAYRYATGTASGVSYASFKLTDSDTAPTYYAEPGNVVRGYTGAGYTVDRWINAGTDKIVLIKDDGLYFPVASDFFSNLDKNLYGETVTYSVLTDKGLISATGTMPNAAPSTITEVATRAISGIGRISMYARDPSSAPVTFHVSFFFNAGVTAIAAKLELGSQQTLAHQENGVWVLNEIPNYADTLARCQSHQLIFDAGYEPIGIGQARSSSSVEIYVPTPVTFRTIPVASGKFYLRNGDVAVVSSGVSVENVSPNSVRLLVTANVTAGMVYEAFTTENDKFILNANIL